MDLTPAFTIALADNGFIVVQHDAYENNICTRLCPTEDKVIEFLRGRLQDSVDAWNESAMEEGEPARSGDADGFDIEDTAPECFGGREFHEDLAESDKEYQSKRKKKALDKPKPPAPIKVPSPPVSEGITHHEENSSAEPPEKKFSWKFWQRKKESRRGV
jgi:hypothetical protein